MQQQDIYALLDAKGIPYTVIEHPPAYTVEDIERFQLPRPESGARNLFLRDDKKQHYYLLVVKDDTPLSIRAFQKAAQTRKLSFASEEDLKSYLDLTPGAVTPLGILSDAERKVHVYMDSYFQDREISVHPCINTASIYLPANELCTLIREHGNTLTFFDFQRLEG